MTKAITPEFRTVDGLRIRYAEGGSGPRAAVLLSPWPESVFAFEQVWPLLSEHARLLAVDPPGFGGSERRDDLMNPKGDGGVHCSNHRRL
jgi:pimeloyl-ACP methyl ester carboxylesterase